MRRLHFLLLAAFVAYTGLFQHDWRDFGQPKVVNPRSAIRISIGVLIDGRDNDRITALLTASSLHLASFPSYIAFPLNQRFAVKSNSVDLKIYLLHGVMLI